MATANRNLKPLDWIDNITGVESRTLTEVKIPAAIAFYPGKHICWQRTEVRGGFKATVQLKVFWPGALSDLWTVFHNLTSYMAA